MRQITAVANRNLLESLPFHSGFRWDTVENLQFQVYGFWVQGAEHTPQLKLCSDASVFSLQTQQTCCPFFLQAVLMGGDPSKVAASVSFVSARLFSNSDAVHVKAAAQTGCFGWQADQATCDQQRVRISKSPPGGSSRRDTAKHAWRRPFASYIAFSNFPS